jgi:hypothetical protein
MAITQEREDIRLAIQLKEEGWIAEICNLDMKACQERATWCHETFGRMYDNMTWAGKWFGATLPFQDMGGSSHHVVFMFRDDKIHTLFKVMFPG